MSRENPSQDQNVSYLHWLIPLVIGLISTGYILFEQVVLQGHPVSSADVVRTALTIGLPSTAIAWLIQSWASKIGMAKAKAQQELGFRNRELAVLNAISDVTSQSLDLEKVLHAALENVVELMELQAGEIQIIEGDRLITKAHHDISKPPNEERTPLGHCLCGRCAQSQDTLTLDNLPVETFLTNIPCAKEGYRSIIIVPMTIKERVVGVILLANRNQSTLSHENQQLLNTIGYRVTVAIENIQLYGKAHRRALHLETASLVGQIITVLLDPKSLLAEVAELIRKRFGYYHVHIFIEDEDTREIVLKEASGPSANLIKARGLRLKIGYEGITGWVAYTGQTLVCNDVSREPRYFKAELVPETKAEMAIPLRIGKRIIGVLDVQSDQLDAFDKEDVTVMQILGNQIGVAIRNARLFQETKQRYEAMVALHETSLDMIAHLDTPRLLESLLRRGTQLLNAQASSLFLYNAEQKLIRNIANYNTSRDWTGTTVRLGEGVTGQVVMTGKPLIVNDYENWNGKVEIFTGDPQSRMISVPLKWQDQVIGSINILNERESRPFDQNDLWLLSQFADLATIAVKNSEFLTQIQELNQGLERNVAERTQELFNAKEQIALKAEQLSSLLTKTIHLQEEERARISRDMHDGVVQLITAARYELKAAKVFAGPSLSKTAEEKFIAVRQVLDETEREIRRTIYDLHPPILDAIGLTPALQKYTTTFQQLAGIVCHMEVLGTPRRLTPATEIAAFRVIEESLHNAATHANAQQTSVLLDFGTTDLCVIVQDDGQGFEFNNRLDHPDGNCLGLLGMQERVKGVGGSMDILSKIGQGTRLTFRLPITRGED